MSSATSKVSFTVRRPTPTSRASSTGADSDNNASFKIPAIPRHLSSTNSSNRGSASPLGRESPTPKRTYGERDSSDEDEEIQDELVTGFDQFGVQRLNRKPEPEGPLVIPALKNRDWRELARKRKQLFVPPTAGATTGADGSVGGLGTRDSINSGPQLSGLQLAPKKKARVDGGGDEDEDEEMTESNVETPSAEQTPAEEETEDQRALRAVLASAQSADSNGDTTGPIIEIIPTPVTEDDAFKQDVVALPDSATLDDYERVPVSQFGAALLRGMGWKEGEVASKSKRFQGKGQDGKQKGLVEPWIPAARPALLGIGAKEKEVFDDGSKGKGKGRPDKRYVPILKVEKNGSGSGGGSRERDGESRSGSSSRRRSPEPSRGGSSRRSPSPSSDRDRRRERERDRDRDREYERERGNRDRDSRRYDSDGDRPRRRDKDGAGERRDYKDSSRRDRDRESDTRRDRERSPNRIRKDRDRREY
ncbi:DExH-box splicing factor binding site-domain-containing protein [Cristinia sonorae]|uniref:DExH-box splicing factor binding site-domain-containing protein n=1 Tax=Cristinia sonorae TaxID=1940300 RepID=A0A8K0UGM4_9AGAR|nr:DExH-box splicing factor binding site-domain-containing protein [Cristinia sonorae]